MKFRFFKDDPSGGDIHVDGPMAGKIKLPKSVDDLLEVEKIVKAAIADARGNNGQLRPRDDGTAHTPFPYDVNALGNIASDQKPRFFGAITNPGDLPTKKLPINSLVAMQDRVDPAKVEAMRGGKVAKPIVVTHMNGRNYIADGHHRATADFLDGKADIVAAYKDLDPVSSALKSAEANVVKVDTSLGLVFGWAIVCKVDGEDYYDVQDDHIPEPSMLKAGADYMENSRSAADMHTRDENNQYVPEDHEIGKVIFAFPITEDIAKAMGLTSKQTGLMIAMKPASPDILAKYESGEYTGFSIGGRRINDEAVI